MDQQIVTAQLHLSSTLREPAPSEIQAAGALLDQLQAEAKALGSAAAAAPVHYAMGRVWIERLGDPQSAAICYQNAFTLDPKYRPNLEAARRLFASEGRHDRALALHEREELLLADPAAKAESLRAQARLLSTQLKKPVEAAARVQQALALQPDHPGLLQAAVQAAEDQGDKHGAARILLRSAQVIKDDVQRALLLRRAVLVLEQLLAEAQNKPPTPAGTTAPPIAEGRSVAELEPMLADTLRRLHGADPGDPIALEGLIARARATGAWDEVAHLSRALAEQSNAASDRLLVAQICAYKLGRPTEALSEIALGLEKAPHDPGLRALQIELLTAQKPDELPAALSER
ncbi:MAG: hypothetical protein JST92_00025, partial [Deltaproteobacteria bacterium]|nr:hypothetical protein [Deltaproteobacteria bacterium]